jgi:lysozyme family protein
MADFSKAIPIIKAREGGYVNDPTDRGKETNHGITVAVARDHGYTGPMKDMTWQQAVDIYHAGYWDTLNMDMIVDQKTAEELLDISVHCGWREAGKIIQQVLNFLNRNQATWPDLVIDGIVGSKTLTILNALIETDKPRLYKAINGEQYVIYRTLWLKDPGQEKYTRGWLDRT